ncbi:DUF1097 domain-containing protein [Sphingobacterium haloxyli]|uniref:DUF1097 domain-containing protein n=1 Tax=Sphingobacterium haloxyli TaxID=2100533 RepID=A0A2S9J3R4_9SPHI|nr:DUF1097 domain-containing protein [Sphingobacterium haloxyli]PRD47433.1 hypothetical protein C5745_08890 [Sphingobacterium haloxyli]
MQSFYKAISLGILASLATIFTFSLNLPTWVLFLGWTSLSLLSPTKQVSLKIYIQQLFGILIAIIIVFFGNFLIENLSQIWFHLSVGIVLTGVFYVTKLKTLNVLPAYFIGMIVWFGLNAEPTIEQALKSSVSLFLGFLFGWVNYIVYAKIDNSIC